MTGTWRDHGDRPQKVHIPAGFAPYSGGRVKAVCACGWSTRPLASQPRALAALESQHGITWPICRLCGRDRYQPGGLASQMWDPLHVVTDSQTGDQFLACNDDQAECARQATQRQLHLDRAAFDALHLDLPTQLRILPGGTP